MGVVTPISAQNLHIAGLHNCRLPADAGTIGFSGVASCIAFNLLSVARWMQKPAWWFLKQPIMTPWEARFPSW
jgi:hypothetical protein